MKKLFPIAAITACTLVIGLGASAQHMDGHRLIAPQDLKWGPAPPGLPTNARAALLFGDPGKAGLYAVRLKASKGYFIPPHTHPTQEAVTVISGTILIGEGNTADRAKAKPLPAGGMFVVDPGHAHYLYFDGDAEIQANGIGPFTITYVNPNDDPRKTK